ncbi:MAG: hypothetical protein NTY46_16660 [Candidatus Sumerlaeota bacterium]|nr:hypothetical protein [Candidatus Sumerlaeota bacterium]
MESKIIDALTGSRKVRLQPDALGALAGGKQIAVLIEVSSVAAFCQGISEPGLAATQTNSASLPPGWREVPSVLSTAIVKAELDAGQIAAVVVMPSVVSVQEDREIRPHAHPGGPPRPETT